MNKFAGKRPLQRPQKKVPKLRKAPLFPPPPTTSAPRPQIEVTKQELKEIPLPSRPAPKKPPALIEEKKTASNDPLRFCWSRRDRTECKSRRYNRNSQ